MIDITVRIPTLRLQDFFKTNFLEASLFVLFTYEGALALILINNAVIQFNSQSY
jgi:hypothetical protein